MVAITATVTLASFRKPMASSRSRSMNPLHFANSLGKDQGDNIATSALRWGLDAKQIIRAQAGGKMSLDIPSYRTSNTLPNPSPSRVSRFYIECLRDRELGPRTQKWMYTEILRRSLFSKH
jgi:hypothetical protein